MQTKSTLQKLLVVFVLSVVLIVSSNTYVSAQFGEEGGLTFQNQMTADNTITANFDVPGGPGYVMVSAFDFKPYDPDVDKAAYVDAALTNTGTESKHVAGLTLPHGASVKQLTIYFLDLLPANDFHVILFRVGVNGVLEYVGLVESYGGDPSLKRNYFYTSTNSIIDNQNYSYFLLANFPASTAQTFALINVRIDYGYDVAAPLIMN